MSTFCEAVPKLVGSDEAAVNPAGPGAESSELCATPDALVAEADSVPVCDGDTPLSTAHVFLEGDDEELPLASGSSGALNLTPNPVVPPDVPAAQSVVLPDAVSPAAVAALASATPATQAGGGQPPSEPPVNNVTHAQDAGQPAPPPSEEPMSLLEHLNELRHRLTRVVILVILGFVACYGVSEQLYAWLSEPLKASLPEGSKLIFTAPQGAFFAYLKTSLVASLFLSCPFSFYQIWSFIAPGLYKEEKQAVMPLALFSAFFFVAGASFCYYLVLPIAFQFFMGFTTDIIIPMISVEEYLSFVLKLLIAFGLVFEMPLFAYFLARMGLLTPEMMRRHRKYAILLIFVVAAILTPPDVFSQVLMACPMLLLYELSIYVAKMARKNKDKNTETPGPSEGSSDADKSEASV